MKGGNRIKQKLLILVIWSNPQMRSTNFEMEY